MTDTTTARVHEGVLEPWIETGTEGAIWTLAEDGPGDPYARMRLIEAGDYLTVRLPDGRAVFDGVVERRGASAGRSHGSAES
ncbi:MAG TPA: hypothetical protein VG370_04375 [Chloroflexota bacterium]|nr:hypothetical protein [Chloroflexota bacterium]